VATDTTTTTKRKTRAKRSAAEGDSGSSTSLRLQSAERSERRFEPKSSAAAAIAVLVASLATIAVGAGTYGQWLRGDELGPHKYAFVLLAGGAAVLLAVALFGPRPAKPVRVGDAGLALEKDAGEIERIAWCDVTRVLYAPGVSLTFQAAGSTLAIPLGQHANAAAKALAEARARIPGKVEDIDAKLEGDANAGEAVVLEAAQVAGQRCKATDKLISFERDARLCGRCGEVYHKDGVPSRCATCDAKLR
jgi:hypothetical protein